MTTETETKALIVDAYRALVRLARAARWYGGVGSVLDIFITCARNLDQLGPNELEHFALVADYNEALIEHTRRGGHVYYGPNGFIVISGEFPTEQSARAAAAVLDRLTRGQSVEPK